MSANYVLLEKITVGAAGASSVTFTSIPQTYTDLVVKLSTRSSRAGIATAPLRLYPNGSSTNITLRYLQGAGNAVSSGTQAVFNAFIGETDAATATASTFANFEIYIPNYTSSNYKSISVDSVQENNQTVALSQMTAFLWSNTAAITSLEIVDGLASFVQHSTFYLYGVAKLGVTPTSAPKATGGDEIKLVGSTWYHVFTSSGTFRPSTNLDINVLSVGGGGGGGISTGGGGGAGELDLFNSLSLTANTNYTATIGAGGAGNTAFYIRNNGNTTTFSSITSLGGGGGGNEQTLINGGDGGSGGGGGWQGSNGSASGSNTFAGGNGYNASGQSAGGGGGGATAAGTAGSNTNGGNGGQGYLLSTADANLTSSNFAAFNGMTRISSGGGAGASSTRTAGTGGTGGGNGTNSTTAGSAATSFGSGGGGGGWVGGVGVGNGGNGYSGIIIIKYPA